MSYLNNTVATLSYTLNTYNYIYVNVHLYSGTDHNKKIKHIEELSNLLDDIKSNNPSAYLIISGDSNVRERETLFSTVMQLNNYK